jgi:hypothetical protein
MPVLAVGETQVHQPIERQTAARSRRVQQAALDLTSTFPL